jgi:hypothetical protein
VQIEALSFTMPTVLAGSVWQASLLKGPQSFAGLGRHIGGPARMALCVILPLGGSVGQRVGAPFHRIWLEPLPLIRIFAVVLVAVRQLIGCDQAECPVKPLSGNRRLCRLGRASKPTPAKTAALCGSRPDIRVAWPAERRGKRATRR